MAVGVCRQWRKADEKCNMTLANAVGSHLRRTEVNNAVYCRSNPASPAWKYSLVVADSSLLADTNDDKRWLPFYSILMRANVISLVLMADMTDITDEANAIFWNRTT